MLNKKQQRIIFEPGSRSSPFVMTTFDVSFGTTWSVGAYVAELYFDTCQIDTFE